MGTDELRYRFLLIGRAIYLSTLWGMVFGGAADVALGLAYASEGGLVYLVFIQFAFMVGGIVGSASGAVAGLALALSGRRVIRRMPYARLVTGSAATVVPLVLAWYLQHAQPLLRSNIWLGVGSAVAVAAAGVAAALFTPRVVNGSPPPGGAGVPLPVRPAPAPPVPLAPAGPGSLAGDSPLPRRLIVGRGVGWGIIGGTVLGAFTWVVWCVQFGEVKPLALVGFAALFGAAVGGCLGLVAGLVLALAGSWAVRPMYRAQLITGGVVTALLLVLLHISRVDTLWGFTLYLNPSLAVAAALAAVLLTPCIITGMPEHRDWRWPGGRSG
ncbi:hypothetical protein [Jatrophihabitans sp.]|uniref:hypothetical protein n=1 Tax=Jatrophihabitans sp. TaxID=1932789 RepID=UPI002CE5B1CE|nr:hypothetical protein [Jatrophihabitans sp.]